MVREGHHPGGTRGRPNVLPVTCVKMDTCALLEEHYSQQKHIKKRSRGTKTHSNGLSCRAPQTVTGLVAAEHQPREAPSCRSLDPRPEDEH